MITLNRAWFARSAPDVSGSLIQSAIPSSESTRVSKAASSPAVARIRRKVRVRTQLFLRASRGVIATLRSRFSDATAAARERPAHALTAGAIAVWALAGSFLGLQDAFTKVVEPALILSIGWLVCSIYTTQKRDGQLVPRKHSPVPNAPPELEVEELDDRALVMLLRRVKDEVAMRKAFNFALNHDRSA